MMYTCTFISSSLWRKTSLNAVENIRFLQAFAHSFIIQTIIGENVFYIGTLNTELLLYVSNVLFHTLHIHCTQRKWLIQLAYSIDWLQICTRKLDVTSQLGTNKLAKVSFRTRQLAKFVRPKPTAFIRLWYSESCIPWLNLT